MIEIQAVSKSYPTPAGRVEALRGVDLSIERGQLVVIRGRSGSGKSTLLNMMSGIDKPSTGVVRVAGTSLQELSHDALAVWRGRTVGVVFQFFQLLPTLTVLENVMLPMDFCGTVARSERAVRAQALLERVDVGDQARKLPSALSGGQQQRVAIARALANDPPIVVADEPTGNLDSDTGEAIFSLFGGLAQAGRTVVIVTHEPDAVVDANRFVHLTDGCLTDAAEVRSA